MIIIIDNGVTVAQLDREGLRSTRNYLLSIIKNLVKHIVLNYVLF